MVYRRSNYPKFVENADAFSEKVPIKLSGDTGFGRYRVCVSSADALLIGQLQRRFDNLSVLPG